MMTNRFIGTALVTAALILTGCGGADVQQTTRVSKGQELTDLQRALDGGAITKAEYDRLRQRIVDRAD
jgi:outer membrane lipopolysaccharide assembly protein LptE/RlpB